MNKQYWKQYYQNLQPTPFAKFCVKYLKNHIVADIGCGNMRDTKYFNKLGIKTIGVDFGVDCDLKMSLNELMKKPRKFTAIYSRFFLHCLSNKEISQFIKWANGRLFMAEFRVKGDKPKLFTDHQRNLVDINLVKQLLLKNNYRIIYFKVGRNMAKYKEENPLVARVISVSI